MGVAIAAIKQAVRLIQAAYPSGLSVNMAMQVLTTPNLWVPMACIHGVYVLPGIPRLFQAMISANSDRFKGAAYQSATLYSDAGEGDVAKALREVAAQHPNVRIGSYPSTSDDDTHQVKIQLESRQSDALADAKSAVSQALTVRE